MKRHRPYALLILFLAVALLAPGLLEAQAADTGPQAQADAFLGQARTLLDAGDVSGARTMASSALEVAPDYSEALYLEARLEAADRPDTRAAIQHVRASLRNASWIETDPAAAEQLLTDLLIRTGELTEARRMAETLTAARPNEDVDFLLLSRAYDRAGNASAQQRTLLDAMKRFPENDDIRLSYARLLQRSGRSAEASALVHTGLQIHPDSTQLLLASAGLEIDRAKKIAEIEQYLAKGGSDPLGPVMGMEAVPVSQRRKYLDLFFAKGGLSRLELVGRAMDAAKGNAGLSAALRAELARYSGTRDLDADSDGFWEERWEFENGKVVRWFREPAQDGVAQYAAEFSDGRPVSFSSRDAAGRVTVLSYSRYPSLEKASVPGEGTFIIVPYTMQFPFLRPDAASGPEGMAPRAAAKLSMPTVDSLRRGSYRVEQYAPDGVTPVRRTDLSGGLSVFMEESSAGDGVFDHRVWYTRGQPEKGARSLSRDGVFQVTETWKGGRLAGEAVDTDGDGRPDYHETYGASAAKSWDFNEDGRDDSREYEMADGTRVREFATKLNGLFDLKIATRGSRILSLVKGGVAMPVAPDPSRGVTWIGRPAAAAGLPDPARGDGIQIIAGRQYLVFRLAGVLYAEAVEE
jgi:tetratricopeptide (TPR) repeat protein